MIHWKRTRSIHAPKKGGVLTASIIIRIIARVKTFAERIEDSHPPNTHLSGSKKRGKLLFNKGLPKDGKGRKNEEKVCTCHNYNGM